MDAVLLAAFPILRRASQVAELGTGTGAVSLLLCARHNCSVTGLELDPLLAELCSRNVRLNNLSDRVNIINADVRDVRKAFPPGGFDLVVANPPYRPAGKGRLRKGELAPACHELAGETQDFIFAAAWLLKYRGKFCLVQLPERLPELLAVCREYRLEPKRLQFVQPYQDKAPTAFLLEAIKGARPGLNVLPSLVVYNKDGSHTKELLACYDISGSVDG